MLYGWWSRRERFRECHEDNPKHTEKDPVLVIRARKLAVRPDVRADTRVHISVPEQVFSEPGLRSAADLNTSVRIGFDLPE